MLYFKFDEEKAVSVILYIAKKLIEDKNKVKPDFHKIFKILYFADQKHLAMYGRPIVGDYYIAMDHGPVPSKIYDILKVVRGDSLFEDTKGFGKYFDVRGRYAYPKQAPDMDVFSESELDLIDKSIEKNKSLSFLTLREKSHDEAYRKATKDDKISYRTMARVAGADNAMVAYMRTLSENEQIFSKGPPASVTNSQKNTLSLCLADTLDQVWFLNSLPITPHLQK